MLELRSQLLDAALAHIPFDGWNDSVFSRAATEIGRTSFDVKRAFPGGTPDALLFFSSRADDAMLAVLMRDHNLPALKIRERIANAVMVRLRVLLPHREAVRRAVGFYALPWNLATATRSIYATADAMWRAAGDTSTDYNFYTKRLLLSGVYTSTQAVWLNDFSENLEETEAFLRRRIDNVMQIEKAKAGIIKRFA